MPAHISKQGTVDFLFIIHYFRGNTKFSIQRQILLADRLRFRTVIHNLYMEITGFESREGEPLSWRKLSLHPQ